MDGSKLKSAFQNKGLKRIVGSIMKELTLE
jgi:hypothetical protein